MANKYLSRNMMTFEKGPVTIYGKAAIGVTGAPTLNSAQSKGIFSIVRTGVGAYTINLGNAVSRDTYQRLMMFKELVIGASSTCVGCTVVADNSSSTPSPNVAIQLTDGTGTAVELANGVSLLVKLILSNTTAF